MKTIALTILILLSNVKDTSFDYDYYSGNWMGDKTKYSLFISKKIDGDFDFTNYKQKQGVEGNFGGFEYSPEKYVKKINGKLHTYISWTNYYCDLVYEPIDKNKMKAVFTGDWDGTIIYTRVLVDIEMNNSQQVAK